MRKILLTTFLYILLFFNTYSQTKTKLDSLQIELKNCNNECEKANIFSAIANTYWDENTAMMKTYAELCIQSAAKCPDKVRLSLGYNTMANYYAFANKHDSAIIFNKKALELYRFHKDDFQLWSTLNGLSNDFCQKMEIDSALKYCDSAIKVAKFGKYDKPQNISYLSLGNIYYATGNFGKAQKAYLKGIEFAKLEKDEKGLVDFYSNYSALTLVQGKVNDSIIEMLNFAIDYYRKIDHKIGLGTTVSTLGAALTIQKNFEEAIEKYKTGLKYFAQCDNLIGQATNCANIAENYYLLNKIDSTKVYADLAYKFSLKSNFATGINISQAIRANYNVEANNFLTAIKQLKEAYKSAYVLNDNSALSYIHLVFGKYFLKINRADSAVANFKKSVHYTLLTGNNYVRAQSYEYLYKVFFKNGYVDSAFKYLLTFSILKDSISNENLSWTVNKLNTQFKVKDKNILIENANLKNKLLRRQNTIILLGLVLALTSLILLSFFYRKIVSLNSEIKKEKSNVEALNGFLQHETKRQLGMIHGASKKIATSNDPLRESGKLNDIIRSILKVYDNILLSDNKSEISLKKIIEEIFHDTCISFNLFPKLKIEGDIKLSTQKVDVLMMALNEIIANSFEHAFKAMDSPMIKFKLSANEDYYTIHFMDNGNGFEFNENELQVGKGMYHLYSLLTQNLKAEFIKEKNTTGTNYLITVRHDRKKSVTG